MDIALIQEPWVYGDRIRGLRNRWGMLFSAGPGIDSRVCILVRNTIQAFPLLELCSKDVVTVRLSISIHKEERFKGLKRTNPIWT
jgi:hypothetical protein